MAVKFNGAILQHTDKQLIVIHRAGKLAKTFENVNN